MSCLQHRSVGDWFYRTCPTVLWSGVVLLVCAFGVSRDFVHAAPVTVQFEATVDNVSGSAPALVQVEVGELINGSFTYEPTPLGSRSEQMADLSFEVGKLTLLTHAYEIRLENDQVVGTTNIAFDTASISCSLSTGAVQCDAKDIPELTGWNWEPFINFSGNGHVLEGSELLGAINWNGFSTRELRLTLTSNQLPSAFVINSIIGLVSTVPEPAVVSLVLVGIGGLHLSRANRLRSHKVPPTVSEMGRKWGHSALSQYRISPFSSSHVFWGEVLDKRLFLLGFRMERKEAAR